MKNKKRKKPEFSKVVVAIIIGVFTIVAIWSILEYYLLIREAIMMNSYIIPEASLPITCVSTILGAILSYLLYSAGLKRSLNKNQLTIDAATGVVRAITSGNPEEIINSMVQNDFTEENTVDENNNIVVDEELSETNPTEDMSAMG